MERRRSFQLLKNTKGAKFLTSLQCHLSESSRAARVFQTAAGGFRSAGLQTCCVADFQVGKINGSRTGNGFGNPRYSRLGSPRYFGCGYAALRLGD
jgi:hypothetical protein